MKNSSGSSSSRRSSLIDHHHHSHFNNPSFSSSLLEEIYRSFDEDKGDRHIHHSHSVENSSNSNSSSRKLRNNKSSSNNNNSCYIEREIYENNRVNRFVLNQWMENSKNERMNLRRNSMAATAKFNYSSSTSSSDSSSGIGGFTSSDSDHSLYGSKKSKVNPKITTLKPIRTNVSPPEFHRKSYSDETPAKKKKSNTGNDNKEGNLQKRALKLYGDLKKVKQPISPGGKLASFLNSLFNTNSSKKQKMTTTTTSSSSSSKGLKYSTSTPSTASTYSRSCLSKTPSSAGRFERRSVRFCPVSTVIAVDKEYSEDQSVNNNEDLKVQIMEKHRRVEEVAKELLKNYHHGRNYQNDVIINNKNNNNNNILRFDVEDEDEDEEDDVSCCSSDLFELENLLEVGVDRRYREELPVYETTHVNTNRAIANGFIL